MPTATCPECGTPLRPGAKFCGNCGLTLPALPTPKLESALSPVDGSVCPHCGSPVRSEARFCNRCGKPLGASTVETSPAAGIVPASLEAATDAAIPKPPPGVDIPPAAMPAAKQGQPGAVKKSFRRSLLWIVSLAVVAGCGLAGLAGYFAARQFGWFARQTPLAALSSTPVEAPATRAPTLPPPTDEPVVTASLTRPLPTQTVSQSTATPALTVTPQQPETEPAPVETQLAPLPAVVLLFEDTFDDSLRENWRTWGEPRATISSGFGDHWLSLKALDPGQAGVTTRPEVPIPNTPGVAIEFDAEMDEKYPQAVLFLDWDSDAFERGPLNQEPGSIRLEIWADALKLYGRAIQQDACERLITGTDKHTYLLQLTEGQGVALYLDGAEQPLCQIDSTKVEPQPGTISLSGLGWVSRVKVSLPE